MDNDSRAELTQTPRRPAGRHWSWVLIGCVMLLSCRLVSCRQRATQARVDEAGRTIQAALYAPADSVLLAEVQSSEFRAYARRCTGTSIELVYGTNRSLEEVTAEYKEQLFSEGWIPHPGYNTKGATDYYFFQKGPETAVSLTRYVVLASLKAEELARFSTIYVISIDYVEPAYLDCVG